MQILNITPGETSRTQNIYDFMVDAYDQEVQCSPVLQVLTVEQIQSFVNDPNNECRIVAADEDATQWMGFAVTDMSAAPSARIVWLNARKDYFGDVVTTILTHYASRSIAMHGMIMNEYLRNIYTDVTIPGGTVVPDQDNPVVFHMIPD